MGGGGGGGGGSSTPNAYAKAFQKYKDQGRGVGAGGGDTKNKKLHHSQYNSINSFQMTQKGGAPDNANYNNTFLMHSGHQSILSVTSNTNNNLGSGRSTGKFSKVAKCSSNENFSQQVLAINTEKEQTSAAATDGKQQTMVHHHSPQSSLFVRQNLSPGPGFKMGKERNSMFDNTTTTNTNTATANGTNTN